MDLQVHILSAAQEYIDALPVNRYSAILRDIYDMKIRRFDRVHTKHLKGEIRELVSGNHRITYFKLGTSLYYVRGFRKKTSKTPRQEIVYAERIYKIISGEI